MNESIKDRFLKEHALNDDDLEKVSGGETGGLPEDYEYLYLCSHPDCPGHTISFGADSEGSHCPYCNGLISKVPLL